MSAKFAPGEQACIALVIVIFSMTLMWLIIHALVQFCQKKMVRRVQQAKSNQNVEESQKSFVTDNNLILDAVPSSIGRTRRTHPRTLTGSELTESPKAAEFTIEKVDTVSRFDKY